MNAKQELQRYIDKFGDIGARWYADGKTFEQATDLFHAMQMERRERRIAELTDQIADCDRTIAELEVKLAD